MGYHQSEFTTKQQVAEHIGEGVLLDGGVLSAALIFEIVQQPAPSENGWVIRNAVLAGPIIYAGKLALPAPICFVDCVFLDRVECTGEVTFASTLSFQRCRIESALIFDQCVFAAGLIFDAVVAVDRFSIARCRHLERPEFTNSQFHGEFDCRLHSPHENETNTWKFDGCVFGDHARVTIPNGYRELAFDRCKFLTSSYAQLWSEQPSLMLRLVGCELSGRMSVVHDEPDGEDDLYARANGLRIDLSISTLKGVLDLTCVRLKWFDFHDVVVHGGMLLLRRSSLSNNWNARTLTEMSQFSAFDRCGVLLREQIVLGSAKPPPDLAELTRRDHLLALVREYGALRSAFANTPTTDWHQDFCHYKYLEYKRQLKIEEAGRKTWKLGMVIFGAAIILLLALGIAAAAWKVVVLIVALAGVLALSLAHQTSRAVVWSTLIAVLDTVFLKWLLGYGVLARRVVVFAALTVGIFALMYGILSRISPDDGIVHTDHDISILKDIVRQSKSTEDGKVEVKNTECANSCRRLLYFSAVTFTTLGYGDYKPVGRAQYFASIEAALGIFSAALVTVIFARRYLRL